MRAINLLPADATARKSFRKEDPAVVAGSALGAVVMIALAAGFLNVHSKVGQEQAKLDAARQALAQLSLIKRTLPKTSKPVKIVPIVPVPAVTSEEQPRLAALTSAMAQRISWDRILREFSLVLPDDVSITSLQLTQPNGIAPTAGAAAASPTSLTVSGSAFSHDGVARFLSRLMLIPDLDNVTLANSSADAGSVQFSISAGIKGAPAPVAPVVPTPAPTATTTTGSSS